MTRVEQLRYLPQQEQYVCCVKELNKEVYLCKQGLHKLLGLPETVRIKKLHISTKPMKGDVRIRVSKGKRIPIVGVYSIHTNYLVGTSSLQDTYIQQILGADHENILKQFYIRPELVPSQEAARTAGDNSNG